jgi:spore coat protein U-like protein
MFSRRTHISHAMVFLLLLIAGTADKTFAAESLELRPYHLLDGKQNTYYMETLTGAHGNTPYIWTLIGSLPPGLTFTPSAPPSLTAVISGIPTQAGTFPFTVQLTDSSKPFQKRTSNAYSITIHASTCTFVSGNTGGISFGTIDPFTAGQIYGNITTQVQFTCTSNKAYTITVSPLSGWLLSGPIHIPYTLGVAPSGTYAGSPVNLFIPSGTGGSVITQANYQNAPAGLYRDGSQTTITVSWTRPAGSITAMLPINSVSGTLLNVCQVSGTPVLNFGNTLDAAANAGGVTAKVTPPVIYCTNLDSVTISNDKGLWESGAQPRLKSGGNFINYNFTYTTRLNGAGNTTDIGGSGVGNLALSAYIPAGALDNAPAGTYTDTVTLTISY